MVTYNPKKKQFQKNKSRTKQFFLFCLEWNAYLKRDQMHLSSIHENKNFKPQKS